MSAGLQRSYNQTVARGGHRETWGLRRGLVVALAGLLLSGCLQAAFSPAGVRDSDFILFTSDKLTLAWDPPDSDIQQSGTEVVRYQVFYRQHGLSAWQLLGEVPPSENPEFTILHDRTGDGFYDFAVRATTADGNESPLLTSLDPDAFPEGGWYLMWVRSL